MNRDSREIYGLFDQFPDERHAFLLRRALNASIILCEDFCIMPPGFIIEDDIAFGLAEVQRSYLQAEVLRFPMRESNLQDYAEKKRLDYEPIRNRYSGLFDDTRLDFLGRNASGLIKRQVQVTDAILKGWAEGPDRKTKIWSIAKKAMPSDILQNIVKIPKQLYEEGTALTWSAMQPSLPPLPGRSKTPLRNTLQNTYFNLYCREFDLIAITNLPHMHEDFFLPKEVEWACYRRLSYFLDQFHIREFLLNASAEFIIEIRKKPGFISFMDSYARLARKCKSELSINYAAGRAAVKSKFGWAGYAGRHNVFLETPTSLELLELDNAFAASATEVEAIAAEIEDRNQEPVIRHPQTSSRGKNSMATVVIFVSLHEELEVLCNILGLKISSSAIASQGEIGGAKVDILCAREMGRVPAAITLTSYLQEHHNSPPKLILILGLAGGFKESKSAPGHIICADKVVDLANRKVQDDESGNVFTRFRRHDYDLESGLAHFLQSHEFDKEEWRTASIEGWPEDKRPSLHYGSMTSLDEVVASDDWRTRLLENTDKLLGVEMEAGGVCAAGKKYNVKISMLRVVSDSADPSKSDDNWRRLGMTTLAKLVSRIPFKHLTDRLK